MEKTQPTLRRRATAPSAPATPAGIIEPRTAMRRTPSASPARPRRPRAMSGSMHGYREAFDSGLAGLRALLYGTVRDVEETLKVLEEETEEDTLTGDLDLTSDEEVIELEPNEAADKSMLPPARKRRRKAAPEEVGLLKAAISQARAYLESVKASLPDAHTLHRIPMPTPLHMPALPAMPDFGFPSGSRMAALRMAETSGDHPVEPWRFPDTISHKLQRMHDLWIEFNRRADAPVSKASSDDAGPVQSPSTYSLASLYAGMPQMPTLSAPPPMLALRAFFEAESARLGRVLAENRASAADAVSRVREAIDHEAERLRTALREGAKRLLHYDELPEEWRNNEFILTGYRFIPADRWRSIIASAFSWHNETMNVWTHALGALSLVYLVVRLHPDTPQAQSPRSADAAIVLGFISAAITCLTSSTVWHLFSGCGTSHVFNTCACLDYVGISALISASIVSMIHYGFWCEPALAHGYIAFALAMGAVGLVMPWTSWFNRRENKGWRIAFFLALCASAIVPEAHMGLRYGFFATSKFFRPVYWSCAAYVVGLLFYAFNFPEAFISGRVDIFGHSHQFWHVAIVAAVWLHWRAITQMHLVGTTSFSCAAPAATVHAAREAWSWRTQL